MISDTKVEALPNAERKLTVTIDKKTLKEEYHTLLNKYAKTAMIKGFRKGKVPPEVLERKFGESIRAEVEQQVLEEGLKEAFDAVEEKPIPYARPVLDGEPEFALESDYTFSVRYDVFPEVTLGEYKGLEVEVPKVSVTKEDEERELKAIQEQNALVVDKTEGAVEKDDIATVNYWEVDEEGNEVPETRREDYVFTVGSGYNYYKFDDDILGMAIGEEKVIEKEYGDDVEIEELKGQKKRVAVHVKSLKQRDIPAIDDDLAQDVSDKFETLDDLKKDIRERLQKSVDARLKEIKSQSLLNQIVENSTLEVPKSMVDAELSSMWRQFVQRFQVQEEQVLQLLQAQGRTQEQLIEEWRPEAEKRVRSQLVLGKLIETEHIEVSDEDIDARLADQAEGTSMGVDQIRDYYEKNNLMDYLRQQVAEEKVFDKLLEESKVKQGKKAKLLDVMGGNG
ncbi:MAG: trigger factor [Spirochaetota bacterium]